MASLNELNKKSEKIEQTLAVNSQMLNRLALAHATGKAFGGKRDLYKVLGYEKDPRTSNYLAKYMRQDIAQRIINAFPDAIWTNHPSVQEDEDKQNKTQFEQAFDDMAKRTKLFHYLNRLDKLAGLGHYAVLLIGVRDGKELSEPLESLASTDDVIYLMPFNEENAIIQSYEQDTNNERYGLPLTYKLQTGGYTGDKSTTMPSQTLNVHYSRVLHIAEGMLENDVFGIPRLQPVLNRLDDLEKVVGGSAEIFWINGRGGLNLNADKDTEIKNPEKLQEHAEEYTHQLTRILKTKGIDVRTLELGIHDPDKHVSVLLDLISGTTGIPKRILIGSERGELASSQDENNWWKRVDERRDNYCEPLVLRPFIDRLVQLGALPKVEEYDVVWPDLVSMSEKDKAEIASKKAQSIATYVNSQGGDLIIPPQQFVEEILGMEYREDDIEELLDFERKQMEKDEAEVELQKQEEQTGNDVENL